MKNIMRFAGMILLVITVAACNSATTSGQKSASVVASNPAASAQEAGRTWTGGWRWEGLSGPITITEKGENLFMVLTNTNGTLSKRTFARKSGDVYEEVASSNVSRHAFAQLKIEKKTDAELLGQYTFQRRGGNKAYTLQVTTSS